MQNFLINNYNPNFQKLINYGFVNSNNLYILKKDISSGDFYTQIIYNKESLEVSVFDSAFNEPYIPFDIPSSNGSTVENLRKEIKLLIQDIIEHCFEENNNKSELYNYVHKKYAVTPENPFTTLDDCVAFRTPKDKWFALIMPVSANKLNLSSDSIIEIINLKSNRIAELVDNHYVFLSYHMNKKYWISVLLSAPIELLKQLVDESYIAVTQTKSKAKK